MKKIGITTTVPIETIYAAGCVPVDLNNRFVASPDPASLIGTAEREGWPRNMCAWVKGIYGTALQSDDIETVIAVTRGDCSNTEALMETLQHHGVTVIPFAYPHDRDAAALEAETRKLAETLGATWEATLAVHEKMKPARENLIAIDEMTWRTGAVSGGENFSWLISSSDFEGDPEGFAKRSGEFLREASQAQPTANEGVRVALLGIPPIFADLFDFLDAKGARVVFNEIPRQFSMPHHALGLVEQYRRYTYPYDIFFRLKDIRREIARRNVEGVIHYAQSFCYRQIQDIIVRDEIDLPILTLEGDRPGPLDARSRLRLETFVEILQLKRDGQGPQPKEK